MEKQTRVKFVKTVKVLVEGRTFNVTVNLLTFSKEAAKRSTKILKEVFNVDIADVANNDMYEAVITVNDTKLEAHADSIKECLQQIQKYLVRYVKYGAAAVSH